MRLTLGDQFRISLTRRDEQAVTMRRGDEPERQLPMPSRALGDLLAEELRRLDPDPVYADALTPAAGVHPWWEPASSGSSGVSPARHGERHQHADARVGTSTAPLIVVHRDSAMLAKVTAARLVTTLIDAQAARGRACIALTGGDIGIATLPELADSPPREAIDWPGWTCGGAMSGSCPPGIPIATKPKLGARY